MIRRIIKVLLNPQRALDGLHTAFISMSYDASRYEEEQTNRFNSLGLNYEESKVKLKKVYTEWPFLAEAMASHHHNLFSAFGSVKQFKNILEIGTHDGRSAFLLSTLFPAARVETIDLPDTHPIFLSTYDRKGEAERLRFLKARNELIGQRPNIVFNQMDSTELTVKSDQKYDFIWVDGAHGYPLAAIDITNAVRLLNPGGIIACDDVFINIRDSDSMYKSIASYETINQFSNAGLLKYELVLKRTEKPHAHPRKRKYIAVLYGGGR